MPEGALYWYGNECSDVTGGWALNTSGKISIQKYDDHMMYVRNTSGSANLVSTKNRINTSSYTKLCMEFKNRSGATLRLNASSDLSANWLFEDSSEIDGTVVLSVPSNSNYYVVPDTNGSSYTTYDIYAIWLE